MPLYEAECPTCGAVADYRSSIAENSVTPVCIGCGVQMLKVILTPPRSFVRGRFDAFRSTVDGSVITSERAMQEHNKRNSVVNMADGYDNEAILKGTCYTPHKPDAAETKKDVGAALKDINAGYKPQIERVDENG